jgi:hypothetical protein
MNKAQEIEIFPISGNNKTTRRERWGTIYAESLPGTI